MAPSQDEGSSGENVTQTWISTDIRPRGAGMREGLLRLIGDQGRARTGTGYYDITHSGLQLTDLTTLPLETLQASPSVRYKHYEMQDIERSDKQTFCLAHDDFTPKAHTEFCRKNGFMRPYNAFQMIAYVVAILDTMLMFIFGFTALETAAAWVLGILGAISTCLMITSCILVTKSDPADTLMFAKIHDDDEVFEEIRTKFPQGAVAHCELCGTVSSKSKHCRACNKCVSTFDHHCKWLNNCIGDRNYRPFFILLISVACYSFFNVIVCTIAMIEYESALSRWGERLRIWMDSNALFFTLMVILLLINLVIVIFDVQLLGLHIYLRYHHLTTFEYIHQYRLKGKAPKNAKSMFDWLVINKKKMDKHNKNKNTSGRSSDLSSLENTNSTCSSSRSLVSCSSPRKYPLDHNDQIHRRTIMPPTYNLNHPLTLHDDGPIEPTDWTFSDSDERDDIRITGEPSDCPDRVNTMPLVRMNSNESSDETSIRYKERTIDSRPITAELSSLLSADADEFFYGIVDATSCSVFVEADLNGVEPRESWHSSDSFRSSLTNVGRFTARRMKSLFASPRHNRPRGSSFDGRQSL